MHILSSYTFIKSAFVQWAPKWFNTSPSVVMACMSLWSMLLHGCLIRASRETGGRITLALDLKVDCVIICESRITENSLGGKLGKPWGKHWMCQQAFENYHSHQSGLGTNLSVMEVSPEMGWFWLISLMVTVCWKGQERRSSYSDFINTMKREMCVPLPVLSPLRYALRQRQ